MTDGETNHLSPGPGGEGPGQGRRWTLKGELIGWGRDILLAVAGGMLLVVFVVQPVKVEGTSMAPRLKQEDRILVNKLAYRLGDVQRGDIVVFWYPKDTSKSFVKRVIGLPGDMLEIRSGRVYVDGKALKEPYLSEKMVVGPPLKQHVPPGQYFVLGDHRNASNDSRDWGSVSGELIFGEAVFRYWPLWRAGRVD